MFASRLPQVESGRAMKILIVEDIASMADYLSRMVAPLRAAFPGSEVEIVATLDAALAACQRSQPPDVVLLDLTLPPHGPEEVIAHIHKVEDRSPVVIVTGHSREYIERITAGMDLQIVFKNDLVRDSGMLFKAIHRAVEVFCGDDKRRQQYAVAYARLDELKSLAHATPAKT